MPDSKPDTLVPYPLVPYPSSSDIEGITVQGFPNPASLFERVVQESREAGQSTIYYLNVHVANTAFQNRILKRILQKANVVYCDGAGIVLASLMQGQPLPTRLTAADWFLDMIAYFAQENRRVFLIGGEPDVPEAALVKIAEVVPNHTIVDVHHGFILNAPEVERRAIERINAAKPDILIVGFGTPLQEEWIERNRRHLDVPVVYAIGAVMDFVSGKVPRCPRWVGDAGFEWLYRLLTEPARLSGRYAIGNPWFLSRIAFQVVLGRLTGFLRPTSRTTTTISERGN